MSFEHCEGVRDRIENPLISLHHNRQFQLSISTPPSINSFQVTALSQV